MEQQDELTHLRDVVLLDKHLKQQLRDQNGELRAEIADLYDKLVRARQEASELRTRITELEARTCG